MHTSILQRGIWQARSCLCQRDSQNNREHLCSYAEWYSLYSGLHCTFLPLLHICWPCRHLQHPVCHLHCSWQALVCCILESVSLGPCTHCRYEKPTAIQAQALPAALSGRDVLVSTPPAAMQWHSMLNSCRKGCFVQIRLNCYIPPPLPGACHI